MILPADRDHPPLPDDGSFEAGQELDALFPRTVAGRIGLGLASLFFAPFAGGMLLGMLAQHQRPQLWVDWIFLILVEEFLLGLFLFFSVGLLWAIATPRWLERFLRVTTAKLVFAMVAFVILGALVALWSLWLV